MAKKKRRPRERALAEGGSDLLRIHRLNGDISATIPRKALRYLKVASGDKLQITARNGVIEIAPVVSIQ